MIVDNPRRAMAASVAPRDFRPGLGVTGVRWSQARPGALEVVGDRTWTAAEAEEIRSYVEATSDVEQTIRLRAEQAMDQLRALTESSGQLSATVLSNAVRLLARCMLIMIRLQLRRLDTADDTAPPATQTSTGAAQAASAAQQAASKRT